MPVETDPGASAEMAGRVAIITGASSGIGAACVAALLKAGAIVAGCSLDEPAADVPRRRFTHQIVDVSRPDALERFIQSVREEHGRLDVLINNAGVHPPTLPIDSFSVADFDNLVAVNLRSVFVACRTALPHLRRTRGAIVNMSSAVGLHGQEGASTYCATKAGICGLTVALAIDEAPHGVRVNSVCPGAILTPAAREVHSPAARDKIANWSWMNRWGHPEEVADMVAFLASDRASYLTGQNIVLAGGADLGYGFKGTRYYETLGVPPVTTATDAVEGPQ